MISSSNTSTLYLQHFELFSAKSKLKLLTRSSKLGKFPKSSNVFKSNFGGNATQHNCIVSLNSSFTIRHLSADFRRSFFNVQVVLNICFI